MIIRDKINASATFQELLYTIKQTIIEAYEHQNYAIDKLLNLLGIEKSSELSNIMIYFKSIHSDREEIRNKAIDLKIQVHYSDTQITFETTYNSYVYSQFAVMVLLNSLLEILKQVIQDSKKIVKDIEIINQGDLSLLQQFNGTEVELPEDPRVLRWFEAQVEQAPERVALLWQEQALTYQALNVQVNRLAHALRAQGVGPNSFVGLLADRSPHLLIALLAILKAGGAYLPLDPQHPPERLATIVREAGLPLLLALPHLLDRLPDHTRAQLQVLDLSWLADLEAQGWPDSNPVPLNRPNDACYVLYTSGTTGTPKGVVIEQQALLNRLLWMQQALPIGPTDTLLHKTSIVFDVSVWELLWGLMQGARLHLLEPGAEKDPRQVLETVRRQQITVLHAVPSQLQQLVWTLEQFAVSAHASLGSLRYLIASGEALPPELVRRVYQLAGRASALHVVNLYGPTEATIDVSCYRCPRPAEEEGGEPAPGQASVPIGWPIANTQLYVVSPLGQMQPIGVAGQLCIGGTGLARGYLHRPELTAECFVCLPCCPGQRLYLTGDLARWRSDGLLEFLGRMDTQVKVRGFRIELREIEVVMKQFPHIRDAVVIARSVTNIEKQIDAFIVSREKMNEYELKAYIAEYLPNYMIPSNIIQIDEIPLSNTGKIDRKRLYEMGIKEEKEIISPQSLLEKELVQIWAEVLEKDKERISVVDDFFDIGGHSMSAILVLEKMKNKLNLEMPLDIFLQQSSIRSIANIIGNAISRENKAEY